MSGLKYKLGDEVIIQYSDTDFRHMIWQKMFVGKKSRITAFQTKADEKTLCYRVDACAHWLHESELCFSNEKPNMIQPSSVPQHPNQSAPAYTGPAYARGTAVAVKPERPAFENYLELFKVEKRA